MSRYLKVIALLAIPALLLASGDNKMAEQYLELTGRATDFGPRLFNFVLLVALLYYLLANPIREFLKNRSDSIAQELAEIEKRRQASKDAKIKAELELEETKSKAKEIVEDAKAEISVIKEKIAKQTEQELAILEKVTKEKMEIEKRKVVKETTYNVLNESISTDDIPLDASKIINIVTKEVA
jgi:F-type H+-transporting ATPase subunit b